MIALPLRLPDLKAGTGLQPAPPTAPGILDYIHRLAKWPHVINPQRPVHFDSHGNVRNRRCFVFDMSV